MQIFVYPMVSKRMNALKMLRWFVIGFPFAYLVQPYIAVVPSSTPPPDGKSGVAVWALIFVIQITLLVTVTGVVPALLMLTNFSSPHPSALGRTHSIIFMGTMAVKAASSTVSGSLLGYGSLHNFTGLPFFVAIAISLAEIGISPFLKEGDGHEIRLPGDEDEE